MHTNAYVDTICYSTEDFRFSQLEPTGSQSAEKQIISVSIVGTFKVGLFAYSSIHRLLETKYIMLRRKT